MSKYGIVGDPHLTNKNLDKAEALFDEIEQLNLPTIILGDLFDTKEIIRGKVLNFVYNRIKNSKLAFYILVGNHDYFSKECEDHALQVFKDLDNVIIIDKPQIIDNMYFMPYLKDVEEIKKQLKYAKGTPVLFMHNEIQGFDYGNGHIATEGITTRFLSKFKRVIAGHFHKFQQKGNLTYLGTPFSQSFGESNQTKYLGVYDQDTDVLELVETNFPKHLTYEINCDERDKKSEDFLDYLNDKINYVRAILTGKQENISSFCWNQYDHVKFIEKPSDGFLADVEIDESSDNFQQFQKWADDIKGIDKETINIGLEILESVK